MVLVGAMNVASISTAWGGEIMPDKDGGIITSEYSAGDAPELARGDYMGHFNMGSTIVLIGPTETLTWPANLNISDTVRVGGRLGAFAEPNG
jgi:phosphatidylserine decarboxylase